jgi:hypothetical protein
MDCPACGPRGMYANSGTIWARLGTRRAAGCPAAQRSLCNGFRLVAPCTPCKGPACSNVNYINSLQEVRPVTMSTKSSASTAGTKGNPDKKKKTIIFLHPDLGIGGAERLVVDAAVGLQRRGHRVVIFTSHCDPGHCFDEARDGIFFSFPLFPMCVLMMKRNTRRPRPGRLAHTRFSVWEVRHLVRYPAAGASHSFYFPI